MKTFLAPIYCQTNSLSQEKLTLGLIMFTADGTEPQIFFKLSKKKIQLAEKLTDVSKNFYITTEKYIQNVLKALEEKSQSRGEPLEIALEKNQKTFNEQLYNYLEKYAQGLIEFGALKPYSGPVDKQTFQKLFADFTGDHSAFAVSIGEENKPKKTLIYSELKAYLNNPKIQEKADIGYEFTPNTLPGILKPAKAELITVNSKVESLHAIDFEASKETVSNHLYEYEVFYHALKEFVSYKSHLEKLSIAFKKPTKKSPQEKLFNTALKQKSSLFNFLEIEAIDEFTQKVTKKEYQKFSEVFGGATF